MPRPKKAVANSRNNGSKASNKGKIVAEKIRVLRPKVKYIDGQVVIAFEPVLRAKLHKNEKYGEQVEAEGWVAEAARVVQDVSRGVQSAPKHHGLSYDEARGILASYQEASAGES